MADTYLSLLKGVIAALKGTSSITSIVSTRIYSDVPRKEVFPYIVVSIESAPYDTKTFSGSERLLQITAYSKNKSPEQAGRIRSKAYDLLHNNASSIALTQGDLTNIQYVTGNMFKEPDGVTWQSLIQFRVIIT